MKSILRKRLLASPRLRVGVRQHRGLPPPQPAVGRQSHAALGRSPMPPPASRCSPNRPTPPLYFGCTQKSPHKAPRPDRTREHEKTNPLFWRDKSNRWRDRHRNRSIRPPRGKATTAGSVHDWSVSYLGQLHLHGERVVFIDTNSGLPRPRLVPHAGAWARQPVRRD